MLIAVQVFVVSHRAWQLETLALTTFRMSWQSSDVKTLPGYAVQLLLGTTVAREGSPSYVLLLGIAIVLR